MIIQEHNLETQEIIEREATASELSAAEKAKAEAEKESTALAQKEADRLSALQKLAALGLTEAEIQALAG